MPSTPTESALPPVNADRPRRVRVHHLQAAKERGARLSMLTAYDAPTAKLFDEAGAGMLLVGASYGDNMPAPETTLPTTMADLPPRVRAVRRDAQDATVVP